MNEPNYPTGEIPPPAAVQRASFYIRRSPPIFTRVLLASNLLVFVLMIVYGYLLYNTWSGTEDGRVLVAFGAKVNELIIFGETWRLFTAMFIHIGAMHILFNLYALFALGPMVEGYFGHSRFLIIYILGGLFGSLASFAFSPAVSAGASGAIFGLAGATTVYFLRYRENFGQQGRAILQNMLVVIGINLVFGSVASGIDNWGHIGGLVGGAFVSWGFLPKYKSPDMLAPQPQELGTESKVGLESAWALLCIALLIMGLRWATNNWIS